MPRRLVGALARLGVALVFVLAGIASESRATDVQIVGDVSTTPNTFTSQVILRADEIANLDPELTSGSLRLEYWFFTQPYQGFARPGFNAARLALGTLAPGAAIFEISETVPFARPEDGYLCPSLILLEFDAGAYVPRDFVNFACRQIGLPTNARPDAAFVVSPNTGPAPLTVGLDASASRDPDGIITAFSWASSEGHARSGPFTSMTFETPGLQVITLGVLDDDGEAGYVEHFVLVLPSTSPCDQRVSIGPDFVIGGNLSLIDCRIRDGELLFRLDFFEVVVPEPGRLTVELNSLQIDPLLRLWDEAATRVLAGDDDSGGNGNARLSLDLPAGTYAISAGSEIPNDTGAYSLRTRFVPEPGMAVLQGAAVLAVVAIARKHARVG